MNGERFFCAVLPSHTPLSRVRCHDRGQIDMTLGCMATSIYEHKGWLFPKVPFKAKIANWRSNGKQ